ncbi:aa3-type cytochrome oxidase subunit IV [Actinacidiphila guanduensis]|uniref:Cytochrome c oxidase polypeptide 4 n=1 Tax=Actinacidiphila guanduensis TaxID=310781 RepID=A0A1H0NMG7_9ACTN|nr:cytochrome c oxidase subunit 4 [Actinacidiphila guanduensis]SDO93884.1 Cytochrome c oxidase subunit IV [Actinacidiphila guanduensis]
MRGERNLFTGVACFFLVTGALYGWWSDAEPAGTAALTVAFVMASVIAFFLGLAGHRGGERPEDRREGDIAERAGPVDFFPARSPYPPLTAVGTAICALGVVYGLWLFLLGFGVLASGVGGMCFQYVHRGEDS